MGYTLSIGQLNTEVNEVDGMFYASCSVELQKHELEERLLVNKRKISYSSLYDFSCFVGLHHLMFNTESGLLKEKPGCVRLAKEHKEIIDKAYNKHIGNTKIDNKTIHQLEWLKYWIDWALENCETPVFCNN